MFKPKWSFTLNENMNQSPTFSHHKNAKNNTMHKTYKNLHIIVKCAEISNHQKYFEITQTRIISHP
jgi:hypothetical protein